MKSKLDMIKVDVPVCHAIACNVCPGMLIFDKPVYNNKSCKKYDDCRECWNENIEQTEEEDTPKPENPGCLKCVHYAKIIVQGPIYYRQDLCGCSANYEKHPLKGRVKTLCEKANANLDCKHFEEKD
ncbi:MAG: hypothetical protein KAS32_18930 [Candidatus Peribacteraceae bacterium]|nr:hypothetical protein [Candidatus Peribacteraceae bacterium]